MGVSFQQVVVNGDQNRHHGQTDADLHHQDADGAKFGGRETGKGKKTVVQELSSGEHGPKPGAEVDEHADGAQRSAQGGLELQLPDFSTGGKPHQQQGGSHDGASLKSAAGAVMPVKDDIQGKEHDKGGNHAADHQYDRVALIADHQDLLF